MKKIRYLIFDTETTGLSFERDKIIDIAFVSIIDSKITRQYLEERFNPEIEIDKDASKVHKITNEIIKNEKTFKQKKEKILNFIKNDEFENILVAHNANFDMHFLKKELEEDFHLIQEIKVIDTLAIARKKFPGKKLNLDALCEYYKINLEEREKFGHGALLDSKLLAEVFINFLKDENYDQIFNDTKVYEIKKRTQIWKRKIEINQSLSDKEIDQHNLILKKINTKIQW